MDFASLQFAFSDVIFDHKTTVLEHSLYWRHSWNEKIPWKGLILNY
jgi:hypothetical protein